MPIFEPREYQTELVEQNVTHLQSARPNAVLQSAVGSGKTDMAWMVISRLSNLRVLCLTHNRIELRENFADRMLDHHPHLSGDVNVMSDSTPYDSSKRICVALPSIANRKDLAKYDLLVVDEAHEYYPVATGDKAPDQKLIRRIIDRAKPSKQLLLTATAGKFNRANQNGATWNMVYWSVQDMLNAGHEYITLPYQLYGQTAVVKGYTNVTADDYTDDDNLRSDVKLSKEATQTAVRQILKNLTAFRKTHSRTILGATNHPSVPHVRAKLGKTLVIAHSVAQAKHIEDQLVRLYSRDAVLRSDSYDDVTSQNLATFEQTLSILFLVVVGRGTRGWDCPQLENLIDFSMTLNPERRMQHIGRLMRPHLDTPNKYYVVMSTPDRVWMSDAVQAMVMWLGTREGITAYAGKSSIRNRRLIVAKRERKGGNAKSAKRVNPVKTFTDFQDYWADAARFDALKEDVPGRFSNPAGEVYGLVSVNALRASIEGRVWDVRQKLHDLRQFFAKHKRTPSTYTSDDAERSLGRFVHDVRRGRRGRETLSDIDREWVLSLPKMELLAVPKVGQRFGKWTVKVNDVIVGRERACRVRCDCGRERVIVNGRLIREKSTQCNSCVAKERMSTKRIKVFVGQTFGQWTVVSPEFINDGGNYAVRIRCSCGSESVATNSRLVNLRTTRCTKCASKAYNRRHSTLRAAAIAFRGKTQGLSAWAKELGLSVGGIRHRLKSRMSIDQALTLPRAKTPVMLTYDGKTQSRRTWERELGLSKGLIKYRLQSGLSPAEALAKPGRSANRELTRKLNTGHENVRHLPKPVPTESAQPSAN